MREGFHMTDNPWSSCLERLEAELSPQQFNTWIRPLHLVVADDSCQLLAPNHFVRDWVTDNFAGRISEVLAEIRGGELLPLVVEVGSRPDQAAPARCDARCRR